MKVANAKKFLKACQGSLKQKKESQEKIEAENVKIRTKVIKKICKIVTKY